jgi:hypothetical protein
MLSDEEGSAKEKHKTAGRDGKGGKTDRLVDPRYARTGQGGVGEEET